MLVKQYQESTQPAEKLSPKITNLLTDIELLMRGLDREFLSYCVPFSASSIIDDEKNFYMEREWRTLRDVRFGIDDVQRVILPASWAKGFRVAFPDYAGQLEFPA